MKRHQADHKAEIERLRGQLNLATAMLESAEKEVTETAAFLDALAERMDRWVRWSSGEDDNAGVKTAAAECRKLAQQLRSQLT